MFQAKENTDLKKYTFPIRMTATCRGETKKKLTAATKKEQWFIKIDRICILCSHLARLSRSRLTVDFYVVFRTTLFPLEGTFFFHSIAFETPKQYKKKTIKKESATKMKYRKKIIVSVCLLNGFHCEIIGKNDNLHNIFGQVHLVIWWLSLC